MNRKKNLFILLTVLFAVTATDAFSQVKGKFRYGLDIGKTSISGWGGDNWYKFNYNTLLSHNFGYNLQDNMNVGIKLGFSISEHYQSVNYERQCIQFKVVGAYTYYFNAQATSFMPFVGGGLGYYNIDNEQDIFADDDYFYGSNWNENKIGGFLTTGFEWGKFRLAAEYNLISASLMKYDAPSLKDVKVRNSHLAITAGIYFGGGNRKKEALKIAAATAERERIVVLEERLSAFEREKTEALERERVETVKIAEKTEELERERAEQNKPPIVNIIDPINGSIVEGEQIKISYDVSVKKPTSLKISVDGKPVQLITDAQLGQNTAMVNIPDKDCKITIVAQNEFGASAPAVVNLIRNEQIFKPSLYVLAIGISNYDNAELRLQFPAKDASDFTKALIGQAGILYESVDVKLLADKKATAENIRDGLTWLQNETTNRDIAMLYIAGHGINDNTGDFFFMPVNADIDRINSTCVSYTDIKRTTTTVAGKLIVFMDACHSGNVLGNTQQRAGLISQAVSELTGADSGPVIFTSSTGRQFSLESLEWNNGAFTKALVEGLTGKADLSGRKMITIKSLDYYITNRVKELTGGRQAPTTIIPRSIPDFPIAVVPD